MSRTAHDTPNGWVTGWWDESEEKEIERVVKRLSRKLNRPPSSLVRRIKKLDAEGRFEIWESKWKPLKGRK